MLKEMHRILVQLPQTDNTWVIAAIGALGAIFGALAGGLATYLIEKLKIKNTDIQRRQQAYSELMGRKHMILQYNASYFSELIRSGFLTNCSLITAISQVDYRHIAEIMTTDITKAEKEMSKTINDINEASKEFEIAREADKRSRELQLKLGEGYERLWVTIGLIKLLFSDALELGTYIDPIEASERAKEFEDLEKSINERNLVFKNDVRTKAAKAVSGSIIDFKKLQDEAIKLDNTMTSELKSKIDAFELQIDALLNYLETVI